MNKKTLLGSWKQNIGIIIAAAVVAVGIFYVVKNPEIFTASVLSLQEKSFIVEKWRDIAYKTNSGYVDIFLSEKWEIPTMINFTISFDTRTVSIDTQNMSGQGTRRVNTPNTNDIDIQSFPNQNMDKSQSLIMIPFTGEMRDILLSEAVAKLGDGTDKNLSIGSLNEITSHTK